MGEEKYLTGDRITRRTALSTAGKVAISAVIAGVIAGFGGYYAGAAAAPKITETRTVTQTAPGVATTIRETVTMKETIMQTLVARGEFAKGLRFTFVTHGGEENVFWNTVHLGMKEAADVLGCDAVMIRPKVEGDLGMIMSNFEATIAERPDGIIATVCYEAELEMIKKATEAGIPVVVSNIDAPDPQKRIEAGGLSFIGQNLEPAGYFLAKALSKYYPPGSHVAILIEGPGMVWAEQRAHGIIRFLKEYGCTYDRIDVSFDLAVVESRLSAYLEAHPPVKETKAIMSVGYTAPVAGKVLEAMGIGPGEVAVGTFDIVPLVIDGIKSGYVQIAIDQQPYLQGFLPVVQLTLMKKYALGAWDVDTGHAIVDRNNVDVVAELSKKGYR
ncbi:MAG: substrate-binding domain-containing protein [Candidatus Bathyarchaeia archaeon]